MEEVAIEIGLSISSFALPDMFALCDVVISVWKRYGWLRRDTHVGGIVPSGERKVDIKVSNISGNV